MRQFDNNHGEEATRKQKQQEGANITEKDSNRQEDEEAYYEAKCYPASSITFVKKSTEVVNVSIISKDNQEDIQLSIQVSSMSIAIDEEKSTESNDS
jgi:hypothetical protein